MRQKDPLPPGWLGRILLAISKGYGFGVCLRSVAYDQGILKAKQLPCVVISIGNVTLGGSGKTPMTIYIANLLGNLGYRVAVLSRGYGGRAEKSGAIVSDGSQVCVSADVSGDEPFMMAQYLSATPIIVGANRYRSGKLAQRSFKPDVILLDDGFQHRRLARDLDLVLLDAEEPGGNGHLVPRGVLREPLKSLKRGDALILTRTQLDGKNLKNRLASLPVSIPTFASQHRPRIVKILSAGNMSMAVSGNKDLSRDLEFLNGKRTLAFSGIAANEQFFKMLRDAGCRPVRALPYRDHYRYQGADICRIRQTAAHQHIDIIVTTEKDYYRLPDTIDWGYTLVVVGVEIRFQNKEFDNFLADKVAFHLAKKHHMRTTFNGSK